VQVKSRRPQLGTVGRTQLADWVVALAGRRPADARRRFGLIVEHGAPMSGLADVASEVASVRIELRPPLCERLGEASADALLACRIDAAEAFLTMVVPPCVRIRCRRPKPLHEP
jgi:hypothetical protein